MIRASSSFSLHLIFRSLACASALLLMGTALRADEVQKHFDTAVSLYKEHKTDEALSEFQLALKGAPKDATILRWIGFLNLQRKNYEAAREPLEQAIALDPNSVVAHLNLGNVYDGLKMYNKALEEFQKVTRLNPDSADAYFDEGMVYSRTNRWTEAAEALRTAAKLDTQSASGSRKPNVPARKEDPYIQDALGYALLNGGDSRGAVTAYQKAVSLAPDNAEFSYHLGLAWRKSGEDKKVPQDIALTNARRALKNAVDRSPSNYEMTELYAEVLFDQGNNADAAEQFAKAADLDKTQYNPVYNMAIAYSRQGRYADAEKAYTHALSLVKPGDGATQRRNALNGLSVAQYRQKKYEEAIANLKTITSEYPSETVAWVNLASAYRNRGDESGEIEALRGAIANGANYSSLPQLYSALGALLYKHEDTAGALEQYRLANQKQPNNADTLNGLALTEQKQGKTEEAIRHFQAATKANPRFADAFNNLGVAYENRYKTSKDKADLDRALAAYTQALTIDPNHPLARKNKQRFDKAKQSGGK
jgi:tetratricopeptide (TPR) repeat protein